MISFTPSIVDDLPEIERWIAADPDHCDRMPPEWWITGSDCIVACCVSDQSGPCMYIRIDEEEEYARLHVQFAPESEVPKRRIASTLLEGFPVVATLVSQKGFKGLVSESRSESLIKFMTKIGFKFLKENDYVLMFGEVV